MPPGPFNEPSPNLPNASPTAKRRSVAASAADNYTIGENARPSPRSAATAVAAPPSSRLLAPTKASAAKTSSAATKVAISSPSQFAKGSAQANSKLPRKTSTSTPSTSPAATSKWVSRVADRVASNERAAREAKLLENQKTTTPSSAVASRGMSEEPASSRSGTPLSISSRNTEKALPSRPIASLANAMSPSKDSRCLLDASEKPLQIKIGDAQHEWPTLTPNSAGFGRTVIQAAQTMHAAGTRTQPRKHKVSKKLARGEESPAEGKGLPLTLDDTADEDTSRASSHSSNRSALEAHQSRASLAQGQVQFQLSHAHDRYPRLSASEAASGPRTHAATRNKEESNPSANAEQCMPATHPQRSESVSYEPTTGMPPSAQETRSRWSSGHAKTPLPPGEDERAYSPQPLNFSKPRPAGRNSSAMSVMSYSSGATADNAQAPKTASRIPLADPRKATLVDIKSRPSSDASTPVSEPGLSFGNRRVDAPGALQVLDQGVKRRQKQHRCMDDDVPGSQQHVLRRQPTGLDSFQTSSPEGTVGFSESDEDEVTTPSDHAYFTVRSYTHVPPSNSIYTAPLGAIQSQAALPLSGLSESTIKKDDDDKPFDFAADRQPLLDAHSNLVRRLSLLEATGAGAERTTVETSPAVLTPNTKRSVKEALKNVQQQDGLLAERGGSGLDKDTRKHIDTTLSMLEGTGDAPLLTVDDETLNEAFGHLRRDLQKPNKSLDFAQNAAAADEYLSQSKDTLNDSGDGARGQSRTSSRKNVAQGESLEPMVSKWSESTTSAQSPHDYPFPTSAQNTYPEYAARARNSSAALPISDYYTSRAARSIGYPSRVSTTPCPPTKDAGDDDKEEEDSMPPPITTQRGVASPVEKTQEQQITKVPGSICHARHGDRIMSLGAQSIAAPWNKGRGRDPVPVPAILPGRGRSSSKEPESKASPKTPKTPRSRSKSRLVLKKMTGLFSAKKEKGQKSESVPPVPRLDQNKFTTAYTKTGIPIYGRSPAFRNSHNLPAVKMPTLSQPPPTSIPRATSIISSPTNPRQITPMSPSLTAMPTTSSPAADTSSPPNTANDDSLIFANADQAASAEAWSHDCELRARAETDPAKRHRLLIFAKALSDVIIRAREAQISAETALQAANSAKLNAEIAARGVATLHRVAKMVAGGRSADGKKKG